MVGILAVIAIINPPDYLQDLIIFASGGLAGCLLMPMAFSLYWNKTTPLAAIAGMIGALLIHLSLTIIGYFKTDKFSPHDFLGMNPFIWDVLGSAILIILISIMDNKNSSSIKEPSFR